MPARPAWTGVLSFGLVNVKVSLLPSVRSHDIRFHQVDRESGLRIRYLKVAEGTTQPRAQHDIVKAVEAAPGQVVTIEPTELEALAPARSKTIGITDFIDAAEVDPLSLDSSYYVAPDEGFEHAYRLLSQAMESTGRAGVASFVMRARQHLALLTSRNGVLRLSTLHYADEILAPPTVDAGSLDDREVSIAEQLVVQMTTQWQPDQYSDAYREQVQELIDAKAAGQEFQPPTEQQPAQVLDLMEALRRSVAGEGQPGSNTGEGDDAAARTQTGASPADGNGRVEDLTQEELYSRAQELGIRGRSKMSVEELREAVGQAS